MEYGLAVLAKVVMGLAVLAKVKMKVAVEDLGRGCWLESWSKQWNSEEINSEPALIPPLAYAAHKER
jgi:hypothetical protein